MHRVWDRKYREISGLSMMGNLVKGKRKALELCILLMGINILEDF